MKPEIWNLPLSVAGLNKVPEYSQAVRAIMRTVAEEHSEKNVQPLWVKIVPEPENRFDPDALRIEIRDKIVGYVARKDQGMIREKAPFIFTKGAYGFVEAWGEVPGTEALYINVGIPLTRA